jgi:hypothetical protein
MMAEFQPPRFCAECGSAYPWTESSIAAARELAEEAGLLNREEKEVLIGTFNDLVQESPRTPVAVAKFKRLAKKAGSAFADALKTILVETVSEAVKRQLWQ